MKEQLTSLKKNARVTGLLYLLFALVAMYGFLIVQPRIIVSGNVTATAQNMLSNETLYRTCVAAGLVTNTLFVVVLLRLYNLFRNVNVHWARLMVGLVLVAVPVSLVTDALKMAALMTVKGEIFQSFQVPQVQNLAVSLIKITGYTSQMVTLFWGLWLMPLGMLVYQSRFIPRILGVLLLVNGMGYAISSFAFILLPAYQQTIDKFIYPTYFMGEVPLIIWLLIFGVRDHLSVNIVSESDMVSKPIMVKVKEQMQ